MASDSSKDRCDATGRVAKVTATARILVTGGSGQVGQALQGLVWPEGLSLYVPDRRQLDLSISDSCRRAFVDGEYAAVINAGAYTAVDNAEAHVGEAFQTNATAVAILAEVCRDAAMPLVHVSTDYVFNGVTETPWSEEDPTDPLGVYGASKLAGELAVTAAGGRTLILRTAWVVSPWGHNFVKTMLRLARDRTSISVVDDQIGSPTSAQDLAAALQRVVLRMIEDSTAPTGIYHYVNSGHASWAELAEYVFSVSRNLGGPYASVQKISSSDYHTPARRPAFSVLSTSKIENHYGVNPKPWHPSVEKIVESLLSGGEKKL